ncbi:hypothetical protein [Nitrobacter sp.]
MKNAAPRPGNDCALDDHWMIARDNSLPMIATGKVLRCELRAPG